MNRIVPTNWREQVRIFEEYGCVFRRQKGSHMIFRHPKARRAIVIPKHRKVAISIIKSNMKTVGMSVEEYLELARNI